MLQLFLFSWLLLFLLLLLLSSLLLFGHWSCRTFISNFKSLCSCCCLVQISKDIPAMHITFFGFRQTSIRGKLLYFPFVWQQSEVVRESGLLFLAWWTYTSEARLWVLLFFAIHVDDDAVAVMPGHLWMLLIWLKYIVKSLMWGCSSDALTVNTTMLIIVVVVIHALDKDVVFGNIIGKISQLFVLFLSRRSLKMPPISVVMTI